MAGCSARRAFARNRRFRWMHLGAIAFVVAESWLGILCPLTEWESALRLRAGDAPYTRGFIADRVAALVYYDLPGWVFTTAYTTFGALVLLTWWRCPPAKHTSDRDRPGGRHVVE